MASTPLHARQRSSSRPPSHPGVGAPQAPPHDRSTSTQQGHGQARRASGMSEGQYVPPQSVHESDYDFCNAFWLTPQVSRANGGRDEADEERDWGRGGYETLLKRVGAGGRVLEDARGVLRERAAASEEFAKRMQKLARHPFGTGETGHMERAVGQLKAELDASAKSHLDLAQLLRRQEEAVKEFEAKRDGARKNQQAAVEKLWKTLLNQRQHVVKAKGKYEDDAIQINALRAQASLLQGKELDKVSLKLDKVQQTVAVNERDYRNYVNVLKETTVNWNMTWKTFCDLVQDQEEERLEFLKSRLWDYANGLSTVALAEDESAERTRTSLEQCDPRTDIQIFVQRFGTGNAIPDPIPFHDVASKQPAPKQGYKTARFQRSSTRIPGVKHSPSAVGDISRQMGQQPPARQPSQPDLRRGSQDAGAGGARPPSRSANHASNPSLVSAAAPAPAPVGTPARPPPQDAISPPAASPGRFAVSPSANLRGSADHSGLSSVGAASRPGHISAGAFQNRQSVVLPQPSPGIGSQPAASPCPAQAQPSAAPARYEPPVERPKSTAPPSAPAAAPAPAPEEDDEDDPLLQAMKVLQNTPIQAPSRPANRSSVDLRGLAASPSQQQQQQQQPHHRTQSSLRLAQPPAGTGYGASRSRPTSPAPHAAMMQPPSAQGQGRPASPSPAAAYGQAFPGERSRPASRAGSNVSAASPVNNPPTHGRATSIGATLASPPSVGNFGARPASPSQGGGGYAGVGARGRSPSPQPYIPESLRPASPAMQNPPRASSPQPGRPASGFGAPPPQQPAQQQAYGPPPPGQYQQPYGAPPPAQQQPYGAHAASPPPQSPAPFSSYAPPPGVGQAPSQHFQQPSQSQSYQQFPHPQQHQPPSHQHHQQPSYPPPHALGANGYAYPVSAQPPPQQQQPSPYATAPPPASAYARPPSVIGAASPANAHLARAPSTHSSVSGVSGASIQQTPAMAYQPQAQGQQQPRAPSVASVRAGGGPPPTGQYTESGQPILFYVNALYDYAATSAEEFSFSTGDVIAVTGTDADGWWQGNRVGDVGPSKLFPSNFTELLP
ncbi:hypothetical protein JCM10207_006752 [Rhodosporidiobolus poonsookiae]